MRVVLVVLAAAALTIGAPQLSCAEHASTPTAAGDACEGLATYGRAFTEATEPLTAFLEETRLTKREPATLSAPEWLAYAEQIEDLQVSLKKLEPPPVLADWHQFQIERLGYLSTFARSSATIGAVATAMALSEQTKQIERDTATIEAEMRRALASCPEAGNAFNQARATPAASS